MKVPASGFRPKVSRHEVALGASGQRNAHPRRDCASAARQARKPHVVEHELRLKPAGQGLTDVKFQDELAVPQEPGPITDRWKLSSVALVSDSMSDLRRSCGIFGP
jgi:hypothetical protein